MVTHCCYEPFPDSTETDGVRVNFSLPFDRVLQFYDLFSEKGGILTEAEKVECVYDWFVKSPKKASPEFKVKAIDRIVRDYISQEKKGSGGEKLYDFRADSSYIYSSFMLAYGLDLFSEHGRLPWWKFVSLFEGLPEDSKIKKVIEIRARPFPKSERNNQEMINQLAELKRVYALPVSREEREKAANDGWNRLFDMMLSKGGG